MARHDGHDAADRVRPAAVGERVVRRHAPLVVGHVRLGDSRVRAVERPDDLVDLVRHARRPPGRHARFDDDEHDRLHALPHRFEKSPQSIGLRHARHGVDHDGILVHRRRLLVAVAHPGQRLLARSLGRAVVRIHGRFRRHAVGVTLQHTDFRSVASPPQHAPVGGGSLLRRAADDRVAVHLAELGAA
mgnify:CR=1 FL=1